MKYRHVQIPPDMDAQLEDGFDLSGVPDHLRDGLLRYVRQHIRPGSVLCAVLNNHLGDAVRRGDAQSLHRLRGLLHWLDTYAPSECYGYADAVYDWTGKEGE